MWVMWAIQYNSMITTGESTYYDAKASHNGSTIWMYQCSFSLMLLCPYSAPLRVAWLLFVLHESIGYRLCLRCVCSSCSHMYCMHTLSEQIKQWCMLWARSCMPLELWYLQTMPNSWLHAYHAWWSHAHVSHWQSNNDFRHQHASALGVAGVPSFWRLK